MESRCGSGGAKPESSPDAAVRACPQRTGQGGGGGDSFKEKDRPGATRQAGPNWIREREQHDI